MLKIKASAPAKLILCGEHAAVFFQPAIVMAIDKQAYVTVEPRRDQAIFIKSQNLGLAGLYERNSFKPKIGGAAAKNKLEPIKIAAEKTIKLAKKRIGINISIDSNIPVASGLGSSAAVAVATIAATGRILDLKLSKERICALAYEAEKIMHYHPSGIDNYISTYGGINVFRRGKGFTPIQTKKIIPLVIGNTQIPRSTGKLVSHVHSLKIHYPKVVNP
ncbi:MAG TPA: mevalonate kinase, partial [archaeon]|nr:mevalonate kinase [archaeon]